MLYSPISERDLKQWEGKIISKNFTPGYMVLSFLVSYVGAWTTLELINRRTSSKGSYNWSLLFGSSVSMGGIAVWCMHYIGNMALVLGSGDIQIQISYSPGFTALSFFLPVFVIFVAFAAVGSNEKIRSARIVLGGTLAGLGICGMHYLGQAGIRNYDCIYNVGYVVGAAIIAIVASITALGIFFVFRSTWSGNLWKRGTCALILAVAVSGMHWLGSFGTQYRLKKQSSLLENNNSRIATIISVTLLSFVGCFVLLLSTLIAQARKARIAHSIEQVTLATAIFDKDGKLMVTLDGLLPTKRITDSYHERSLNDVWGISNPSFLWMYRTSRNWSGVSNLIPGMRDHLHRAGLRNRLGIENDAKLMNDEGTPIHDYSIVFRELFCAAAADLAEDLGQPMENLGILFDEIISTGNKIQGAKKKKRAIDIERGREGKGTAGNGQFLFLVREADRRQSEQLQAAGYRFATPSNVLSIIAGTLQITLDDLTRHLECMRQHATEVHILDHGVHLALFAVRASMAAGFDVLARKDSRNQLPTMQLPFDTLESWQTDFLRIMDSFTVAACMKHLNKTSKSTLVSAKEKIFARQVLTALEALKDEIDDPVFNDASLVAKPIAAPCRGDTDDDPPSVATLITFKLIIPIHSRALGKKLDFTPLVFFKMQQHIYRNSRDHAVFARQTYREFAPVLNLSTRTSIRRVVGKDATKVRSEESIEALRDTIPQPKPSSTEARSGSTKKKFWNRRGSHPPAKRRGNNSSEKNLMDVHSENQLLGGIMVSHEVTVDIGDGRASSSTSGERTRPLAFEMAPMSKTPMSKGPKVSSAVVVSKDDDEMPTYVDELFQIVIRSRR